jgi:uncharacterized membrane protein YidH (DUF202 family)
MKRDILPIEGEQYDTSKYSADMVVKSTVKAADRSFPAWFRIGHSLISFAFTVYKFLQVSAQETIIYSKSLPAFSSTKAPGLLMNGAGILSLLSICLRPLPNRIRVDLSHQRQIDN